MPVPWVVWGMMSSVTVPGVTRRSLGIPLLRPIGAEVMVGAPLSPDPSSAPRLVTAPYKSSRTKDQPGPENLIEYWFCITGPSQMRSVRPVGAGRFFILGPGVAVEPPGSWFLPIPTATAPRLLNPCCRVGSEISRARSRGRRRVPGLLG